MRSFLSITTGVVVLLSAIFITCTGFTVTEKRKKSVHDFRVQDILGNEISLSGYKGKVLLIVNVASKCGHTPQYEDLQALYDEYAEQGLEVLGFPANNFMKQEPGSDEQINTFCTQKYGVTFPMFSKISVKGKEIHPLYEFLTHKDLNGKIDAPVKWNFQKFLVSKEGQVICSFPPKKRVTDRKVLKTIRRALKK